MSHRDGQHLLPAAVRRSQANATCIWTCFLHLPSNSLLPSCSISSQDKSATCSSNLAPSTGPLWYQFPYGFTRSRNPGSPRFISPTCFECHISWARGHTRTGPCTHKRAHSCALPFHCRHNSQFWLCASLIPLPVSERHVNQRKEAASSAVHVCIAAAPTPSVSILLLLPASVLCYPSLPLSGPFPCQSMHSSLTHLTSSWCSLSLIASQQIMSSLTPHQQTHPTPSASSGLA